MIDLIATGLSFPEGPWWSARDRCLYLVEWTGDRVLALRGGQVETVFATAPGAGPSGLAQDAAGDFWVCLYSAGQLAHYSPGGALLECHTGYGGAPFRGPNDLTLDAQGGVYFTDGGNFQEDWETGRPAGALYYLAPAGVLQRLGTALCFPNGIALAPEGGTLYVAEHRRNRVLHYRRQPGGWAAPEVFHALDAECLLPLAAAFELGPDGMGIDKAGNLWVAHYGGGKVVGLTPAGAVHQIFHLPRGRRPTNVKYHPAENALYVTEAEFGLLYRITL